ncbi:hypothetical protein [Methanococcoides sp. AM1]|uniref:hypothetical protein n=1 Tax=Methanococcoides sp. AM1 TaxID=1201011 RepID=UPI0010841F99|nr:hypothetical protein [Methanococcoides sp. AM1]
MVATGKYHKYNYLKFLIFSELYAIYPKRVTYAELAERLEMDKMSIAPMLKSYSDFGYINRRKRKASDSNRKVYSYQLNILGIETCLKLSALYNMGRELNLRKLNNDKPLQKIDSYTGITRAACEGNT